MIFSDDQVNDVCRILHNNFCIISKWDRRDQLTFYYKIRGLNAWLTMEYINDILVLTAHIVVNAMNAVRLNAIIDHYKLEFTHDSNRFDHKHSFRFFIYNSKKAYGSDRIKERQENFDDTLDLFDTILQCIM